MVNLVTNLETFCTPNSAQTANVMNDYTHPKSDMIDKDVETYFYEAIRVPDTNEIHVLYDDPSAFDDEHSYIFYSDGSAKAQGAWGVYPDMAPGTFSDLMLKLPKTGEINSKLAQKLANAYHDKLHGYDK